MSTDPLQQIADDLHWMRERIEAQDRLHRALADAEQKRREEYAEEVRQQYLAAGLEPKPWPLPDPRISEWIGRKPRRWFR